MAGMKADICSSCKALEGEGDFMLWINVEVHSALKALGYPYRGIPSGAFASFRSRFNSKVSE